MFYHQAHNLRVTVHGDDFTVLGFEEGLDWFRRMLSNRYEVKFRGRIGPDREDEHRIRALNMIIEWEPQGIYYEADPRHADIIVSALELNSANSVVTPGEKKNEPKDDTPLESSQATAYRAIVARGLYLSQDRSDIGYAVKELSRRMPDPTKGDWEGLKRLGRYLADNTQVQHAV